MPFDSPRPVVSTPTLAQATGFPARSIPSSASAHIVVVVVILLLGLAPVVRETSPYDRQLPQRIDLQDEPQNAPLLPAIDSSSASASSPGSASARSARGSDAASSASSMPLIHQRRQHIISNTPDATNTVQTILQPGLEHPRLLATLPVPTMVRMAAPRRPPSLSAPVLSAVVKPAAPPAPPAPPHPVIPKVQSSSVDTVALTSATELAESKIPAYASAGHTFQPPKPPPPPPPAAAKPSAPSVAANSAPAPPPTAAPSAGSDSRNLLVVNAFEVKPALSEKDIPAGEIHGRFEVTDAPSLPEAATTGGSSSSVGVSNSGVASFGKGAGKGHAASTSGASTGGTHGEGAGGGTATVASSGSGHNKGLGNGTGSGTGSASGTGMGNGAGNSPAGGSGSAPFSGMTIVGGSSPGGMNSASGAGYNIDVKNPPGTYGMTIVSSGSSGGGLRDYGVFNDGPVYTVYVDVSKLGIHGARWSLQYSASRDVRIAHAGYRLMPPFPQKQVLPLLPPAVVSANVGRLFVFEAMLKPDGTLEGFRVVETPDVRVNERILASLTEWTFEPASMGNDKVPIKILMGVRIDSAMADTGTNQQAGDRSPADAALHAQ